MLKSGEFISSDQAEKYSFRRWNLSSYDVWIEWWKEVKKEESKKRGLQIKKLANARFRRVIV